MGTKLLALLSLIFSVSSCASQKKVTALADWKGKTIQFGYGGGFTGISSVYVLLKNGQLFEQIGLDETQLKELPHIDKKQTKKVFVLASKAEWPAAKESHPGNTYSSLIYKTTGKQYSVTWGDGKYLPAKNVIQLYKDLLKLKPSTK